MFCHFLCVFGSIFDQYWSIFVRAYIRTSINKSTKLARVRPFRHGISIFIVLQQYDTGDIDYYIFHKIANIIKPIIVFNHLDNYRLNTFRSKHNRDTENKAITVRTKRGRYGSNICLNLITLSIYIYIYKDCLNILPIGSNIRVLPIGCLQLTY